MSISISEHCYYSAEFGQFVKDASRPLKVAEKMFANQQILGDKTEPNEVRSWPGTVNAIRRLFNDPNRHGREVLPESRIILEYRFDNGSRADVILCGKDRENKDSIFIIEMKNWQKPNPPKFDLKAHYESADLINMVVNGAEKTIDHPSNQVGGYISRFRHLQKVCFDNFNILEWDGSVYLFKMEYWPTSWESLLNHPAFEPNLSNFRIYNRDKEHKLFDRAVEKVNFGSGERVEEILKQIRTRIKMF